MAGAIAAAKIESRFTKDELLTHVMIYWVTESIGSSFLPYFDFANAGAIMWIKEAIKTWTGSSKVPAALALFPKDINPPPREVGRNDSSTCNAGRRCRGAATSPRWKNRNCSQRIFAHGSGRFADEFTQICARRRAGEEIKFRKISIGKQALCCPHTIHIAGVRSE